MEKEIKGGVICGNLEDFGEPKPKKESEKKDKK